jgi:hypothetical protein
MELADLKMYLVRNSSGQFYRRVGYGGYGECWTADVAKASVWTKLGTARSRVTYFANSYPDFPIPDLIEISAGKIAVLDEKARVEKAKAAKLRNEARHEVWQHEMTMRFAQEKLESAKKEMALAQAKLDKIKGDT